MHGSSQTRLRFANTAKSPPPEPFASKEFSTSRRVRQRNRGCAIVWHFGPDLRSKSTEALRLKCFNCVLMLLVVVYKNTHTHKIAFLVVFTVEPGCPGRLETQKLCVKNSRSTKWHNSNTLRCVPSCAVTRTRREKKASAPKARRRSAAGQSGARSRSRRVTPRTPRRRFLDPSGLPCTSLRYLAP